MSKPIQEVVHKFAAIPSFHIGCGNDVDIILLVGVDIDDDRAQNTEKMMDLYAISRVVPSVKLYFRLNSRITHDILYHI